MVENLKNIEEIRKYKNKGTPKTIVNMGDIIYFKDCEDTPLGITNRILHSSKDFLEVY